eukprot:TRINITY_DN21813_c0_g1_i1.p1 TRINITY_DN21813_c0_g1~~TRINITY_DN21813_c0_g1_i1.p1  ORF type:complete len:645 (-),score=70.77 TRINITY_DN21813_c0_g1_i1:55-1989(-)
MALAKRNFVCLLAIVLNFGFCRTHAVPEIFVVPRRASKGIQHLGDRLGAVSSLEEAQAAARRLVLQSGSARVNLFPGVHELQAPVHFSAADSNVEWRAHMQDTPTVISGGQRVAGWKRCTKHPHLQCADVSSIAAQLLQPRHLYVNGRRATRCRASATVVGAFAKPISVDTHKYVVSGTSGASEWGGGSVANIAAVEFVYTAQGSPWTESRCTAENISAVDGLLHVYMKQPCFAIVQQKACGQSTHVPAHIESTELSDLQPGQWYLDRSAGTSPIVFYWPLPGEDLNQSDVVMPVLEQLLAAPNASSAVRQLSFHGITFEHATWSRPSTGLGYVEQQSGALVSHPGTECNDYEWKPTPGNLAFNGSRGVSFTNCTFQRLGAVALQFSGGAHDSLVSRCSFRDISGAALQLGSYDTYKEKDPERQERNNTIVNNEVAFVAVEFHGNAGISVGYSYGTIIANNDVGNLTYSGISIGWGWARELDTYAGNNVIRQNYIHDFKLQLSEAALGDGGGIYALGPQPGSVMEGNWLTRMGSGRGGGAFYPDEGSAYWVIRNNVFSEASFCADDCQWLHVLTQSIHDIQTHDCFTDTATQDVHGTNTPVVNITVVKDGKWPEKALQIMGEAGVQPVPEVDLHAPLPSFATFV